MTDAYTYISKPTGANYTNLNAPGKEQYDQASLVYDDSSTFYDGVNAFAYTTILKPSTGQVTIKRGSSAGLVIPLTYATDHTLGKSAYTFINKPTL